MLDEASDDLVEAGPDMAVQLQLTVELEDGAYYGTDNPFDGYYGGMDYDDDDYVSVRRGSIQVPRWMPGCAGRDALRIKPWKNQEHFLNDALLQPLLRAHEAALVAQAEGLDLERLNRTFAALIGRLREMAEVRVHKVELTPATVGHLIPDPHGHAELAEWPEGLRELKGELYELKVHSSRLTAIPDWLGELSCLRTLDLGAAPGRVNNSNLTELPADLGKLLSLETLALRRLAGLGKLPDTVCNLTALKSLTIENCDIITELPADIGNLRALHTFVLESNAQIKKLPDTVGRLTALANLRIAGLWALTALPACIGGLRTLHTFVLACSPSIKKLPDAIGRLTALVELKISRCWSFQRLPDTLELTSLEKLKISECEQFKNLPMSISNLTRLKILVIQGCPLRNMPCIEALTELHTLELIVSDRPRSKAFKALSRSLPCLKQLETLCLGRGQGRDGSEGSEDDYDEYDDEFADDPLSEKDVLAIGRALKAWPLPLLNRVSGNDGDEIDFEICQKELGLPTPGDQDWRTDKDFSASSTLAFFREQQKKVEAFASGMQQRLGASSCVSWLDEHALMMIVDQVLGGWRLRKQWQQQQPQQQQKMKLQLQQH